MMDKSLEFDPNVLYTNKKFPLYTLHKAEYGGEPVYLKAFVREEV